MRTYQRTCPPDIFWTPPNELLIWAILGLQEQQSKKEPEEFENIPDNGCPNPLWDGFPPPTPKPPLTVSAWSVNSGDSNLENPNLLKQGGLAIFPRRQSHLEFSLFLPLATTAFGSPEGCFSLAIIAFGSCGLIVPKC